MASVDSGVETSNESNESSIAQEPKALEISPIKISRGVNVLIPKTSALGDSNTEEKSYINFFPESLPSGRMMQTYCEHALEREKFQNMSSDTSVLEISSAYPKTSVWNVEKDGKIIKRAIGKTKSKMYSETFKRSHVIRHERQARGRTSCPYIELRRLESERKLRLAASCNNEELVAALLESGVNPNGQDNHLRTPLHLASCRGFTNIVRMLLEKGANPNQKDELDNTPLHLAACTNHVEVVTLLLKAGTDLNSSDYYGRSPLQLAQSKLKFLHQCFSNNEDTMRIKQEVQKIIEMILTFIHKKGQDTQLLNEVLNSFQSRFTISQTKEEVKTDVRDLLNSLNDLNLNK